MIVMGSKMDGGALREAAMAHAKAIEGMDAKGVLTQADFQAINAGLGKAIASAGTQATMDVYNEMVKLVGSSPVPNYLFSKVNPKDAVAAYNGLLEFKDVVTSTCLCTDFRALSSAFSLGTSLPSLVSFL